MKKLILFIIAGCFLSLGATAQFPKVPKVKKPKVKVPKVPKKKEVEAPTETKEVESTTSEADKEEQTKMAYYFNDKNAELSSIKNLSVNKRTAGYYSRQVSKFNPTEVNSKIEDCKSKWPDLYNSDFWVVSQFQPGIKDFGDKLQKENTPKVNGYLTEIEALMTAGNYIKANESIKNVDSLAQSILAFNTGNQEAVALKKKVESQQAKIKEKLSAYYSSPFHAEHAGQVMFSKKPIVIGSETEDAMTSSLSGSENMYMVVYLNGRIKDYDDKTIYLRFDVNTGATGAMQIFGSLIGKIIYEYHVTPENENLSYINVPLVASAAETGFKGSEANKTGTESVVSAFAEQLKAQKQEVTVKVLSTAQYVNIEQGEVHKQTFSVDCSGGMDQLKKLSDEYYKLRVKNARVPKAIMSNSKLEADFNKFSPKAFKEPVTAIKSHIVRDWAIEYHEYSGAPLRRFMNAYSVIKQNSTGKCYYVFMIIAQEHLGGGKYGSSYYYSAPYSALEIECGNINK